MVVCLSRRLPIARRQVALHLPRHRASARLRAVLRRRARRVAALDRSRVASTCSRPSSPRRRSRCVLAKFFGESRRGAHHAQRPADRRRAITAVPFLIIARQPDLGTAVTLLPVLFAVAFVAGMPMRHLRRSSRSSPCWLRRSPGSSRCRTIRGSASRPSWTRSRTPGAPAISRSRPASPSDPAGSGAKASAGHAGPVAVPAGGAQRLHLLGARRGAGVCRRASSALGLYLFVIMRALEAARLAKDRLGAYLVLGVLPPSRSRSSTTSPCRRVWRRSRD